MQISLFFRQEYSSTCLEKFVEFFHVLPLFLNNTGVSFKTQRKRGYLAPFHLNTILYDVLMIQPDPEELEFTAAQGILVCLEDAVKSLTDNQGLSSITENWGFVPRAVKELAAIEEGYTRTSISTLQEAERLKGIYDEVLNDFLASSKKSTNIIDDQKKGNDDDEVDDDATEVMSDVDSQETVNYNSDETIVLDSDTIVACTHKLMERFGRSK